MNECNLDSVEIAQQFLSYPPFHYMLLVRSACCAIGFVLIVFLLVRFRGELRLHPNVKIIFYCFIISYLVFCFGMAISQGAHFLQMISGNPLEPCGSTVPNWFCILFRSVAQSSASFGFYINGVAAGERVLSQLYNKKYEHVRPIYAVISISAMVGYCAYRLVGSILDTDFTQSVVYCAEVKTSNAPSAATMLFVNAIVELVAIGVISVVFYCNRKESRKISDLSTRYHLRDSLRVAKLLIPLLTIHSIFNIASLLVNAYFDKVAAQYSFAEYRTILLMINLLPYKMVFVPCALHYVFARIEREKTAKIQKMLDRSDEKKTYFDSYRTSWDVIPTS